MLLPIFDQWDELEPDERRHLGWQYFHKNPEEVFLCPRCMPPGIVDPDEFYSYDDWLPDPHCLRCHGFGVVHQIEVLEGEAEEVEQQTPEEDV